jgi:hypothetical protein
MKDLFELLTKLPEFADEFVRTFAKTLQQPRITYPPINDPGLLLTEASDGEKINKHNPKLFTYAAISIFIGLAVQSPLMMLRTMEGKVEASTSTISIAVLALVLWAFAAFAMAAIFRMVFRSQISPSHLFAGSLQLYATVYVLSCFLTLIVVLLSRRLSPDFPDVVPYAYASVHGSLLLFYLIWAGLLWGQSPTTSMNATDSWLWRFMAIIAAVMGFIGKALAILALVVVFVGVGILVLFVAGSLLMFVHGP